MKRIGLVAAIICFFTVIASATVFAKEKTTEQMESEISELKEQMNEIQAALNTLIGTQAETESEAANTTNSAESPTIESQTASASETGRRVLLNETVNVSDWGSVTVFRSEYTDLVQAVNPAEDSLKISASNGKVFYRAEIGFSAYNDESTVSNAILCKLIVDGVVYGEGYLLLYSEGRNGVIHDRYNYSFSDIRSRFAFLFNTIESNMTIHQVVSSSNRYGALFVYAVEIPAEIADGVNGENIVLQIDANGTQLYYQVQ